MKKFLGSLGAGLFVALAASFLLTRNRNVANEHLQQHATDDVLPDAKRIAEEMRDEFVPGKLNTGQPSPELLDLNSCSIQSILLQIRTSFYNPHCPIGFDAADLQQILADVVPIDVFNCDQRTREHCQARRVCEDRVVATLNQKLPIPFPLGILNQSYCRWQRIEIPVRTFMKVCWMRPIRIPFSIIER